MLADVMIMSHNSIIIQYYLKKSIICYKNWSFEIKSFLYSSLNTLAFDNRIICNPDNLLEYCNSEEAVKWK